MNLEITEAAKKELASAMTEQKFEEPHVVRIGISGGGCSGFQYSLQFDEESKVDLEKDDLFEADGFKYVVDKRSMLYLDGTTLDWHEDLSKRGFIFSNPNAQKTCGCGKSFSA